jgi:hypothetical protein
VDGCARFLYILSCPPDAFSTATRTLQARVEAHGTAAAKPWLDAQDAVFANCGFSPVPLPGMPTPPKGMMPPPLGADAPAWLAKDHAYQTAAALFYSRQYDEAREGFLAIAEDAASPWQPLGRYLASRSLLRKASMSMQDQEGPWVMSDDARRLMAQARGELKSQASTHPAAAALLTWEDARLRPDERLHELARAVPAVTFDTDAQVVMLNDYLRLLDRVQPEAAMMKAQEPLTAWIGLMQATAARPYGEAPDAAQRAQVQALARERWNKDRDIAWLLPLLLQAQRGQDLQDDERQALQALTSTSPAWHTVQWHLARLTLLEGDTQRADIVIDAALAGPDITPTTRNRWKQLKLISAPSVSSLLLASTRTQSDGPKPPPIPDESRAASTATGTVDELVDNDFAQRVYRSLPLALLGTLHEQSEFPATQKTAHIETTFARAIALRDWAVADALAGAVAASRATTRHLYARYLDAATPQAKRLAAALIIVNAPELNPMPTTAAGMPRYWGCGAGEVPLPGLAAGGLTPGTLFDVPPHFLSAEQRELLQREHTVLDSLPIRSRWIADELLPWAAGKPDDPEAPKALHFLVAGTRLECTNAESRKPGERNPSREAFQLLHKHWPRSEWAAKTKYWF